MTPEERIQYYLDLGYSEEEARDLAEADEEREHLQWFRFQELLNDHNKKR